MEIASQLSEIIPPARVRTRLIDRATYIVFSPTDAHHFTLVAADFNQQTSFSAELVV